MRPLALALALACLLPTFACDRGATVAPEAQIHTPPVVYDGAARVPDIIVSSCSFHMDLPRALARELPEVHPVIEAPPEAGRVLVMQVITMRGFGQGAKWQGDKRLTVTGKLTEHGKTVGTFKVRHTSPGGVVGDCVLLERAAKDLAVDIADWLRAPEMGADLGG